MDFNIPLDKQNVIVENKGRKENVSLLDPRWKEDLQFVSYQAPPVNNGVAMEEWKDRLNFISEDLHWLLQQPHDKFWCQVIHDNTLQNLLDTYLRFSPRSYDVIYHLTDDIQSIHNEVHRLVFMTCLRMATFKESQEHHITPSVFGEIVYENFLFDIPKIFDLCVLYGEGNGPLLTKMVDNIFTQQPKYNDDLCCAIPTVIQVFHDIAEKCGISIDKHGSLSPQKLSSPRTDNSPLITMLISDFQDIVLYLADIALTLANFLEIHPQSCDLFLQELFIPRLAEFYDAVFPEISQALKMRMFENKDHQKLLKRKLKQASVSFMKVVNSIVTHCFIQPVLDQSAKNTDCIEGFIETFSALLGDRRFLADFDGCYQVQVYLDIITQSTCDVDETRIQYIQEAVHSAFATYGKRRKPTGGMNRGGRTSPDGSPEPLVAAGGAPAGNQSTQDDYAASYSEYEGACSEPRKTGVELESLVSSVKDLLPDLGEGFIELCFEEMGYSMEKVINAVLEERLPPSLQDIDRNLPRTKPEETVLTKRHNVFDDDEFDVFRKDDIDTSKIHKGKSSKSDKVDLDIKPSENMKQQLNEMYGYQLEEVNRDENEMYDDEYDDTYDTNNVGAFDADSADELTARRPFTIPRILGGKREDDGNSNSESDSEESDSDKPIRDEFCQNPALLRQRAEERARWQAQRRGGRGHHRGQNRPSNPDGAERKRDVVGKPKGQGQDAKVSQNRRWKEQHKGGNRRQMADRKRMA
ncbi:activating signal cointegrator 1 complex subunit 2-like [Mytilus californianus]|uniref:activating signal cointegrator 1 complex subunit 2-like n=1 Tax=Mytilus californianus TaxID=6549 RepID=UPI0022479466|nr:activating signal cointegrator 1 complex subunit 2-like [Mytilus californianus]